MLSETIFGDREKKKIQCLSTDKVEKNIWAPYMERNELLQEQTDLHCLINQYIVSRLTDFRNLTIVTNTFNMLFEDCFLADATTYKR